MGSCVGAHLNLPESIKKYLPQFLSSKSSEEMFACLKDFPANIDCRMYCNRTMAESFFSQGDGIAKLKMFRWEAESMKDVNVMILSNSCDISKTNERNFAPYCVYCALIRLDALLKLYRENGRNEEHMKEIEMDIRKQRVTSFFYLPKGQGLDEEYVAVLDRVGSCPITCLDETKVKLFSLSNYGFYMFLLKLSIHFTRIRDGLDRSDLNGMNVN